MAEINNPYLAAFLELETKRRQAMRWDSGFSPTKEDVDFMVTYWRTRETLRHQYAYAIFSQAELELIKSHAPKILSIGAGTGYVEYLLSQMGCEVIAYDEKPYSNHWSDGKFYPVATGLPTVAANYPDHALFLCWPPYLSSMAHECLTAYKGNTVIYIGEGSGMATADDDFHEALDKNWDLLHESRQEHNWDGIHSSIFVYRRKETNRDQTPSL
jgi:hypothetical protein